MQCKLFKIWNAALFREQNFNGFHFKQLTPKLKVLEIITDAILKFSKILKKFPEMPKILNNSKTVQFFTSQSILKIHILSTGRFNNLVLVIANSLSLQTVISDHS